MKPEVAQAMLHYDEGGGEFQLVPSRKRPNALLALGLLLFVILGFAIYGPNTPTLTGLTLMCLMVPTITAMFGIALYLAFITTRKFYKFTDAAIEIIRVSEYPQEDILLPLSDIGGLELSAGPSGLFARIVSGGNVRHMTIEMLDGKRYTLHDVPDAQIVGQLLVKKVCQARGVRLEDVAGLPSRKKYLK